MRFTRFIAIAAVASLCGAAASATAGTAPGGWEHRIVTNTLRPPAGIALLPTADGGADVIAHFDDTFTLSRIAANGTTQPVRATLRPQSGSTYNDFKGVERYGAADVVMLYTNFTGDAQTHAELVRLAADGSVVWSTPLHPRLGTNLGHVVVGSNGDVYVAAEVRAGDDLQWFIARVRGTDGAIRWTRREYRMDPDTGSSAPSLAPLADGSVIACGPLGAPANQTRALRLAAADGTRLWERTLAGAGGPYDTAACGDRVVADRWYATAAQASSNGTLTRLITFSTETGAETRNTALPTSAQAPTGVGAPLVFDDSIFVARPVGITATLIDRVERTTGARVWQASVVGPVAHVLRGADGSVTVAGERELGLGDSVENFVERLRAVDGVSSWRFASIEAYFFGDRFRNFALSTTGDALLATSYFDDVAGEFASVTRIRSADGVEAWTKSAAPGATATVGFAIAPTADRVVLAGAGDDAYGQALRVRTLDAATGAPVGEVLDTEEFPSFSQARPLRASSANSCADGDAVIAFNVSGYGFGTARAGVAKIDTATGAAAWRRDWIETASVQPFVSSVVCAPSGAVYVVRAEDPSAGATTYRVEKLDATDGHTLWSQSAPVASPLLRGVGDDVVAFTGVAPATVAVMESADGAERWRKTFPSVSAAFVVEPFPDGDVLAAATVGSGQLRDVRAVRYAAADGTEQWESVLPDPVAVGDQLFTASVLADERVLIGGRYIGLGAVGGSRIAALAGGTGAVLWDHRLAHGPLEFTTVQRFRLDPSGTIYAHRSLPLLARPFFGYDTLVRIDSNSGAVLGQHAVADLDYSGPALHGDENYRLMRVDMDRVLGYATQWRAGEQKGIGASAVPRLAAWSTGNASVVLELQGIEPLASGALRATYRATVSYSGDTLPAPLRVRVASDSGHLSDWTCSGGCTSASGIGAIDVEAQPAPGGSVEIVGAVLLDDPETTASVYAFVVAPFAVGESTTVDNLANLGFSNAMFSNGFE